MQRLGRFGMAAVAAVAILLLVAVFATGAALGSAGPAGEPVATRTQELGPGQACPFLRTGGSVDVEAMRAYMDSTHGEGSFDQMWGAMGGMHGPGGMHGSGMGGWMGGWPR